MKKYWLILLLHLKTFWNFIFASKVRWADIKGYEGLYQISDFGTVYSFKKLDIVSTFIKNDGYECVALTDKNGKVKQHRIHRLVATTFIPNNENATIVRHIDGNKNNNHSKNLMWV